MKTNVTDLREAKDRLIEKHLYPFGRKDSLNYLSLKHFFESGNISGGLRVALRDLMDEWRDQATTELVFFRKEIREAVADYMRSEGCSCCQNVEDHRKHAARLAKLLKVKKYEDGSGYNFGLYESIKES